MSVHKCLKLTCRSELPANDVMRRFDIPQTFLLLPGVSILRHCNVFVTKFTAAEFLAQFPFISQSLAGDGVPGEGNKRDKTAAPGPAPRPAPPPGPCLNIVKDYLETERVVEFHSITTHHFGWGAFCLLSESLRDVEACRGAAAYFWTYTIYSTLRQRHLPGDLLLEQDKNATLNFKETLSAGNELCTNSSRLKCTKPGEI
ncbi:hypothetical protein EVAR_30641_1 [Eumeta japonica]|uniref:Uncharacterized protein n=1 Tax=Eumeta variegata TaxID=151549 RepID=A0A4C1VR90_EUMVA|nr:hypothetical protein EVAR_30641_1 [Eumeta japonica]